MIYRGNLVCWMSGRMPCSFFLPLSQSQALIQINPTQISHSPSPSSMSVSPYPSLLFSPFLCCLLACACPSFVASCGLAKGRNKKDRGIGKRAEIYFSCESKEAWDGKADGSYAHKPTCKSDGLSLSFITLSYFLFLSPCPSFLSHCVSLPLFYSVCNVSVSALIAVSSLPLLSACVPAPIP